MSDQQTQAVKLPPHSREAEQSVLGGIMLDGQAWDRIADRLVEQDFYFQAHRTIYKTLTDLVTKEKALDVLTVADVLKAHNQLDAVGGEAYLFELARNTPSVANITAYADIIRERSVFRQLIQVSQEIANRAYQPKGISCTEILDEAERKVFAIAEQRVQVGGPLNIKTVLASTVDRIDKLYHAQESITGLATGFSDFDEMTSGLQPADLVIVAARPSMGKTSFAMNIAEHAALKNGKPVLVFSLEMPSDSLAMRMLASLSRIDQHRMRTGKLEDEDWPRITSSIAMLSKSPMFIDDTPALSPAEVRARARRLAKEHGQLGLIMIDYLQLMQVPGLSENRTLEVSEISRHYAVWQ